MANEVVFFFHDIYTSAMANDLLTPFVLAQALGATASGFFAFGTMTCAHPPFSVLLDRGSYPQHSKTSTSPFNLVPALEGSAVRRVVSGPCTPPFPDPHSLLHSSPLQHGRSSLVASTRRRGEPSLDRQYSAPPRTSLRSRCARRGRRSSTVKSSSVERGP